MWKNGEIEKVHLHRGQRDETGRRMDIIRVTPVKVKVQGKKPGSKAKKVTMRGDLTSKLDPETHPSIAVLDSFPHTWHWRLRSSHQTSADETSIDRSQLSGVDDTVSPTKPDSARWKKTGPIKYPVQRKDSHQRKHSNEYRPKARFSGSGTDSSPHLKLGNRSSEEMNFKSLKTHNFKHYSNYNTISPAESSSRPDRMSWPKWPDSNH
jgi:hypothetical protein